jgi:hypothetical protein
MSDPQWGQPGQPPAPEAPTSFPPPPGQVTPPGQGAPGPATPGQWTPTTGGYPTAPAPTEVAKDNAGSWVWLALVALVLLILGLSIPEDDVVGWEVGTWAAFATACCLALFVPLFGAAVNLSRERAWRVAAGGAVGLFVFWLLIVVPQIADNTSFLVTASTAAAAGAAWLAPGRPEPPE